MRECSVAEFSVRIRRLNFMGQRMKIKAGLALALMTLTAAQAVAQDGKLTSRIQWAAEVGTHVYDAPNMDSFKPSLEIGVAAALPLLHTPAGTVSIEAGLGQSAIYASGKLISPQIQDGYSLRTSQVAVRRLFVQLGFETTGKFFIKPQIGFEHNATNFRLFDPDTRTGFNMRNNDSNAFASLGFGYRFEDNKKGVLSFATLGDDSDNQDYRITYSAYFGG